MTERTGCGRRISDRKMEVQFELLKAIAEQNHEKLFEYYVDTDKAAIYRIVDGVFDETVVYDDFSFNIEQYMRFCPVEDVELFKQNFHNCVRKPSHATFEMRWKDKSGRFEWMRVYLASVGDSEGNVNIVAGRILSIQKQKDAEIEIRRKAENDALTGVYNHTTFENLCEEKLQEYDGEVLFVMLDVDDFKIINDTLGHNVGDLVLSQTGYALKLVTLDNGYAGRLGGDEFALMVWGLESLEEIKEFCDELIANLKNIIFDMEYSASIGISTRNGRKITFKDLYYEADQAVYFSKRNGKNQIVSFEEIPEIESKRRVDSVSYMNKHDCNCISEYDQFVYNSCPEYIFIINPDEKSIIFANDEAKRGSKLALQIFDEYISQPLEEEFVQTLIDKYESDKPHFVYLGGRNSFLDEIYKDCVLEIGISYSKQDSIIKLHITNLNDEMHLNRVMQKHDRLMLAAKKCVSLSHQVINDKKENIINDGLTLLCNFYNSDVAAIVCKTDNGLVLDEIHNENSQTLAKLLNESVNSNSLEQFEVLANDKDRVLIGNVNTIKDKYPLLYSKLVDGRILSLISVHVTKEDKQIGTIILFNPKENVEELSVLDMTAELLADSEYLNN